MTSDQRSIGINVLTSDKYKASYAYKELQHLASKFETLNYDHVSAYSTALDEDVEIEDIASEGPEDEHAVVLVQDILSDHNLTMAQADSIIRSIHEAGVIFRLKGQ